jgi:uncharacterized membrane protein YfcA
LESLLLEWLSLDGLLFVGIGVLASLMGVILGAAGFVLLPAMLLLGVPIHGTVAVNKFATGVSSFTTLLVLITKKKVELKKMLPFMFVACLGGISGAFLATRFSAKTMKILACIVLLVMFFFVLKSNKAEAVSEEVDLEDNSEDNSDDKSNDNFENRFEYKFASNTEHPEDSDENGLKKKTSLTPFFVGIYDGGMGPGSGLLYMTFFMKRNFSYVKAAQMTRFLVFSSCMSAFLFYLFYGIVDWGIAIPITVGSIIGSQVGLKIIPYVKTRWVQIIFPIIFLLLFVQVVSNLLL